MATTPLSWNIYQELLFMKAFFCAESYYFEINKESRLLLNLWAENYFPKPMFPHVDVYRQYNSDFEKNPIEFFTHFFKQVKSCKLNQSQKIEIVKTISENIKSTFQFFLIKIVHDYFFKKEQSKITINYDIDLFFNVNLPIFNLIQEHLILPHADHYNIIDIPSLIQTWSNKWLQNGDFALALDDDRILDF